MLSSGESVDLGGSKRPAVFGVLFLVLTLVLAASYLGFRPRLAMYMHTIRWLKDLVVLLLGG